MNNKFISLILLPLLMISCSNENIVTLNAGFVFEHVTSDEGDDLVTLLYDMSVYSFPCEIKIDKPIVAGDQLQLIFAGEYDICCFETFPSSCKITGKIIDYKLIETRVIGIHIDDATIGEVSNQIKNDYLLDNEYVILDEIGRYTSLAEYSGNDLYLSVNKEKDDKYCTCRHNNYCESCPIYIAGLYAYNPR